MPGSAYDFQNYPRYLDMENNTELQSRRLNTIKRDLLGVLDELRALAQDVRPARFNSTEFANYDTQLAAVKTGVVNAITALNAINALPDSA